MNKSHKEATTRLDDLPDVMFVSEVAKALRRSERSVRYLIQRKRLTAIKPGHEFLITKRSLLEFLGLPVDGPRADATVKALPVWRNRDRKAR